MAGIQAFELYGLFGLKIDKGSFGAATEAIAALQRSLRTFTAAAGFGHLISGAASAGTHIIALSKQFGLSTDAVQEWSYVAKQSGSNINELGVAISQTERNLRLFAQGGGSKEVRRTLINDFGLSQTEVAKAMTAPDGLNTVLFKMADAAKKMGLNMAEASAIQIVGGRRAKGFAADLSQGGDAIRKLIEEAHDAGAVVSQEDLEKLKEADNAMNRLSFAFKGLGMEIVAAIGPGIASAINGVIGFVKDLRAGFAEFWQDVKDEQPGAVALVVAFGSAAVYTLGLIAIGMKNLGKAGWIGLLLTAIAELIIHWHDIKVAAGEVWDWLVDKWNGFIDTLKQGWEDFKSLLEAITELPVIKQLIELVKEAKSLAGQSEGSSAATTTPGQLAASGSTIGLAGSTANTFLNDHPFLAALAGGGALEKAREQTQEQLNSGTTIQKQDVNITINGGDANATARAVADEMQKQYRDVAAATNGGKR